MRRRWLPRRKKREKKNSRRGGSGNHLFLSLPRKNGRRSDHGGEKKKGREGRFIFASSGFNSDQGKGELCEEKTKNLPMRTSESKGPWRREGKGGVLNFKFPMYYLKKKGVPLTGEARSLLLFQPPLGENLASDTVGQNTILRGSRGSVSLGAYCGYDHDSCVGRRGKKKSQKRSCDIVVVSECLVGIKKEAPDGRNTANISGEGEEGKTGKGKRRPGFLSLVAWRRREKVFAREQGRSAVPSRRTRKVLKGVFYHL